MTREEAIKRLREILAEAEAAGFEMLVYSVTEEDKEILKMATKALEQESCEDAISRKKVIDTIYRECSGENLDIDFAKVLLLQRKIKAL